MIIKIDEDAIYDVPELSSLLGLHERTVRKLIGEGRIKGKKLGRKLYVTGKALRDYFEAPEEDSSGKNLE